MQEPTAGNLFARSWQLLNRNWAIIVPGLIVAIVAGALTAILLPTMVASDDTGVTVVRYGGGLRSILGLLVTVLAEILTISYTTGMAAAAWDRGRATFADGAGAFSREGGKVFTALLAFIVAGLVAAVLAPFTLGLSVLAFFFLFLYTMAAAVVGDHGGFGALGESYRIATRRFGTTAIIVVLQMVLFIVAGLIAAALSVFPVVGTFVGEIIQQISLAFFTLVIVGEYLSVRDRTMSGSTV